MGRGDDEVIVVDSGTKDPFSIVTSTIWVNLNKVNLEGSMMVV